MSSIVSNPPQGKGLKIVNIYYDDLTNEIVIETEPTSECQKCGKESKTLYGIRLPACKYDLVCFKCYRELTQKGQQRLGSNQ